MYQIRIFAPAKEKYHTVLGVNQTDINELNRKYMRCYVPGFQERENKLLRLKFYTLQRLESNLLRNRYLRTASQSNSKLIVLSKSKRSQKERGPLYIERMS